jgi:ribosome-binding protein aMBF1 (putative translation factor)
MKTDRIAKFEKLVSEEKSGWLEKAKWRENNHEWLEKSARIAIKILRALKEQQLSQKVLANKMQVSAQYINKIVKGSENLSLETISKLECALNIQLIEVSGINTSIKYEQNVAATSTITNQTRPICKVIPLFCNTEVYKNELPCKSA